jgi:hypothetical protein
MVKIARRIAEKSRRPGRPLKQIGVENKKHAGKKQ